MCGIGGVIHWSNKDNVEELTSTFQKQLGKRGPDYFDSKCFHHSILFHARLKIIDLSAEANQPLIHQSNDIALVFNGEIYNFKEIGKKIAPEKNYTSDTHVLLDGYKKWGIDKLLQEINGMFAFCIIDKKQQLSFLCRDRTGQKPLYYGVFNEQIYFSSDIRVFNTYLRKHLSLNYDAIGYYLSELSTPQPQTIWNEVYQIPPAQYMVVKETISNRSFHKYWTLPSKTKEISTEDAIEQVEIQLQQAIVRRTIADVPLGCFLSGGVDSGLIVSMLAVQSNVPVNTYSVGFEEAKFNELDDARIIAKKYGTNHKEIIIKPDVDNDINKILHEYGEPFADSSSLATYYITKAISDEVTVALSGDGGDELFGGYIDYQSAYEVENFTQMHPNSYSRWAASNWSKISSRLNGSKINYGTAYKMLDFQPELWLHRNMGLHPNKDQSLLKFQNKTLNFFSKYSAQFSHENLSNWLMTSSLTTRLLNDYLVKVDRASMANSLEVRSPFLDHKLIELAFSIPSNILFQKGASKFLLKKLGQKYMYKDIFSRKKRGFSIPLSKWLKTNWKDMATQHISDLIARNTFINKNALSLMNEHCSGQKDHTHRIWAMVCLEIWLKENL